VAKQYLSFSSLIFVLHAIPKSSALISSPYDKQQVAYRAVLSSIHLPRRRYKHPPQQHSLRRKCLPREAVNGV
jgi:hypothetical protein